MHQTPLGWSLPYFLTLQQSSSSELKEALRVLLLKNFYSLSLAELIRLEHVLYELDRRSMVHTRAAMRSRSRASKRGS